MNDVVKRAQAHIASRNGMRDDVPHGSALRIITDLVSEITRLRQDLSTAIERAAKVLDDKAQKYNQMRDPGMANHCRSIASSIRSLKTESSNEQ